MNFKFNETHLLYKTISGSHLYGLATEISDVDIRSVFMIPNHFLLLGNTSDQINFDQNNTILYELNRYLRLIQIQNPNLLETLFAPSEFVQFKNPNFDLILNHKKELLSKQCKDKFGNYAISQIKKARGLKKKIIKPIDKKRKNPLDFCYFVDSTVSGSGTRSLNDYFEINKIKQENCGVQALNHMENCYLVYIDQEKKHNFKGILNSDLSSNELRLSSIPKQLKYDFIIYFNKDGYSTYCRDYKEYFDWVEKRNPVRFKTNQLHGKGYDSKNMMHVFRLLETAIDIAKYGEVILKRPNRDFLLKIKAGEIDYDDLLKMADERKIQMEEEFEKSTLPENISDDLIDSLILDIRLFN